MRLANASKTDLRLHEALCGNRAHIQNRAPGVEVLDRR
jgi:hypothetical protein